MNMAGYTVMRATDMRMRVHDGFTLFEVLIVLVIAGIVMTMTIPSISGGMSHSAVQRAASVAAIDLQLAHSMAARQRQPIRISIDTVNDMMSIRDEATPTTIYSQRFYGPDGEHPVQSMVVSDTNVVMYPSGLADGALTITFRVGDNRRRVTMTRAGQVRVIEP